MSTDITRNLRTVQTRIDAAIRAARRVPGAVRLVAVSKTVDADVVAEAHVLGQRLFGENRIQELCRKAAALHDSCEWHFIGHLQRNKARAAVRTAAWIHSVDSIALLERLGRIAVEEGRHPRVLLQVNVSGEDTKSGFASTDTARAVDAALATDGLRICGLMTMAPFGASESQLHRVFAQLRELRDRLEKATGADLTELSMGMSGDFEIAIAEGATLVRVGSAIFGPRA